MTASFCCGSAGDRGVIGDGLRTVSYAALPDYLAATGKILADTGVSVTDVVALSCEQTVAAALTLLGMLECFQSVVLLPPSATATAVPALCRYVARASFAGSTAAPANFSIALEANSAWCGSQAGAPGVYALTSGSTGAAKLAVHRHERLRHNARNVGRRLRIETSDRIALPVPIHHTFGLGAALLPALMTGASIDLQAGSNVLRFLERERAFEPTVLFTTPTFAATLAGARRSKRPYRTSVVAGDRLPLETFERHSEWCGNVVQVYGSTELCAMCASSPDDPEEARARTAGAPLPGVELRLEEGTGQLLCKHEYGFESYADWRGNVTARETWFPTKDLAAFDDRGRVVVLGRCDHRVNRDGLLVSLSEIEAALLRAPAVISAAVVAAGQGTRGVGLVGFCVFEPGIATDAAVLRDACGEFLPRRAVPDVFCVLSTLPALPSGKVDRQALERTGHTVLHSRAGRSAESPTRRQ